MALRFRGMGALFALTLSFSGTSLTQEQDSGDYLFHDSHFHLTNYVQKGTPIEKYLEIMGDKVGRSTLFGIPLQQTWSYENSGDFAPTYYLHTDAPLYYYSFTDAFIANAYLSLPEEQRTRLDPMITGFNPADMYAVDHIRRVLETYPGVFSGIGEFTIHKEFVSPKVAGDVASLTDPALDRVFDFAGEVGLVVILHNDIDIPFAKEGATPVYLEQIKETLRDHPETSIIWAHTGLGRVVHPAQASASATERSPRHLEIIEGMLRDPKLKHVNFDISWDEVAKYAIASPEAIERTARMLNKYPDRFLFGTDNVAPADQETQLKVFHMWDPVFAKLSPEAKEKILKGNYERLFDEARKKVRAWEAKNVKQKGSN
ncbi:amidohydrolase family protein [Microbulbifer guangxiensis]|uniref:amidohydrolase family protein n=1 Tax=Microbulbifer guangxiensis TaxID=2904249 RepID=UPI001F3D6096|nr:amidohydrolase family protein [Microbulbifer guangxiensis]